MAAFAQSSLVGGDAGTMFHDLFAPSSGTYLMFAPLDVAADTLCSSDRWSCCWHRYIFIHPVSQLYALIPSLEKLKLNDTYPIKQINISSGWIVSRSCFDCCISLTLHIMCRSMA